MKFIKQFFVADFQSGLDKVDQKTKDEYKGHEDDIPGIFSDMEPMLEQLMHLTS